MFDDGTNFQYDTHLIKITIISNKNKNVQLVSAHNKSKSPGIIIEEKKNEKYYFLFLIRETIFR